MVSYNFKNMGDGKFNPDGTPRPGYIAKMYWVVIGSFLGFCFLLRIFDYLLSIERKRSQNSKPQLAWNRLYATFTSIARVLTYPTPPILQRYPHVFHLPSIGRMLTALCYLCLLLAFFFYKNPHARSSDYEGAGYRAAWLSITQLPLLVLLSSKRLTIIALLTGSSSSVTLNFFHRWVARGLLLTTTLHMFYMMRFYASFQFLVYQLHYDPITRHGLGTWCVLAWIVVATSIRPIRHYMFELFYVNHVVSAIAFFVVLMKHVPSYAHVYVWISIGFFIADVALRWTLIFINNISASGLRYRAEVSSCDDSLVLDIYNPSGRLLKWKSSQYFNLMFPTLALFMPHPFTVASRSEDGKIQFIIRPKSGLTRQLQQRVSAFLEKQASSATLPVVLDGPYGGPTRALNQFSSVLNVASGVGATYGLAVMRDVLLDTRACQYVGLVWIVRKYHDILPFYEQLSHLVSAAKSLTCETTVLLQIFVSQGETVPITPQTEFDLFLTRNKDYIELIKGKPDIRLALHQVLSKASGETAVTVCGNTNLNATVKNNVAILLDSRGAHTGSGAQGCWVHSEQFQG